MILTNSDGLHTADPRAIRPRALVERVDDFAALDELQITQATSAHGSGGMRSKVVAADMATAAGIETVICSGRARRRARARARRRARGHAVRRPRAGATRASSCGCATPKPSRGRIVVDDGAARALREGGTSLLPVGIVEVAGEFAAGDAVDVVHGAVLIGKGICNYPADELRARRRPQDARGARAATRRRATRPFTGTISCSRNLSHMVIATSATVEEVCRGRASARRARSRRSSAR